jgi:hypothetical protein
MVHVVDDYFMNALAIVEVALKDKPARQLALEAYGVLERIGYLELRRE